MPSSRWSVSIRPRPASRAARSRPLLQPGHHRPSAHTGPGALQGPGAKGFLYPGPDLSQIDPQGPKRPLVVVTEDLLAAGLAEAPDQLPLDRRSCDPEPLQDGARRRAGLAEQPKEQMFGAEPRIAQPGGFLLSQDHGLFGLGGEPREHHHPPRPRSRRRVYFLWMLCLLTPRCSAICCQDHPCVLAVPTCRASSFSSRCRRAATARRPAAGSLLPAAFASLVASLMPASA